MPTSIFRGGHFFVCADLLNLMTLLTKRDFSHEQYSGYHSRYKTTDLEIFDLIHDMSDTFPWLQHCVNHFEVTNVGTNHDLMGLFVEEVEDPVSL